MTVTTGPNGPTPAVDRTAAVFAELRVEPDLQGMTCGSFCCPHCC